MRVSERRLARRLDDPRRVVLRPTRPRPPRGSTVGLAPDRSRDRPEVHRSPATD
jgi:hypothetical protein